MGKVISSDERKTHRPARTTGEHLDILVANTLSAHGTAPARMTFIVEIGSAAQLDRAIRRITSVPAVLRASRKR